MDLATARTHLRSMTQYTVSPILTDAEIEDLLLMARARDFNGYGPYDVWAPATPYRAGLAYTTWPDGEVYPGATVRVPTVDNGHLYIVTHAGISGGTEPAWPLTAGTTVADGGVTWREAGFYYWTPTWDLRRAAAEGWRWKAAKVAAQYEVSVGTGKTFKRDQQYAMCLKMAEQYGGSGGGGIRSARLGTATAGAGFAPGLGTGTAGRSG
jgi:hypothetical protein